MTNDTERDALARIILASRHPSQPMNWYEALDNADGVLAAGYLSPEQVAAHDARVKAEALREAAGVTGGPENAYTQTTNGYIARWLRDRADRIEDGEG